MQDPAFIASILTALDARTGVDFSTYRPATVERRIRSRMMSLGLTNGGAYLDRLRGCQVEPQRLIERLTIKVSRFYRHRLTFDCLRHQVLPALAAARGGAGLRIWSLGTGAGEEAYTLAMLLDEAAIPGMIEASDVDPGACEAGRAGVYPATALTELPIELLSRYLEPSLGARRVTYRVRGVLRSRVRFSQYDATRPGPVPGAATFDLIVCRNVLIYLLPPAQEQLLWHLRGNLSEGGYLCLGEAESPTLAVAATPEALPRRTRIFRAHTPDACASLS